MEARMIGVFSSIINEIFIKKLSVNVQQERPKVVTSPLNINNYVSVINFNNKQNRILILSVDTDCAKKLNEIYCKKYQNNEKKDINISLNEIGKIIFIELITKVFDEISILKNKNFSIKSYQILEPDIIYFISAEIINLKIILQNIGNIEIFLAN